MRSIPLYDASAPIACTIEPGEVRERLDLLERLRTHLVRVEPTDDGVRLHFPRSEEVEADLRRFAADEGRCCRFWGFSVDVDGEDLSLRWDAPPDARDLLARIVRHLEGDEPLTSLAGLL